MEESTNTTMHYNRKEENTKCHANGVVQSLGIDH